LFVVSTQVILFDYHEETAGSGLETTPATSSAAAGTIADRAGSVVLVRESFALAPPSVSRHFDAMNVWFPADSSTFGNRPDVAFERSLDQRDALNWILDTRDMTSSSRLIRDWPRSTVVESAPMDSDHQNGDSLSSSNEETPPEFELDEVFADPAQLFAEEWEI
jgi:hypothetical protein